MQNGLNPKNQVVYTLLLGQKVSTRGQGESPVQSVVDERPFLQGRLACHVKAQAVSHKKFDALLVEETERMVCVASVSTAEVLVVRRRLVRHAAARGVRPAPAAEARDVSPTLAQS